MSAANDRGLIYWFLAVAGALLVALFGYHIMTTKSCPTVASVAPDTGSADPSFVYTISGAGLTDVNVTSPAGSLNYTAVNDSTIYFSFEAGSTAKGRVVVTLTAPSCSAVNITVFITVPFAPILEGTEEGIVQFPLNSTGSIACSILGSTRAPAWYFNNVPLVTEGGRILRNDSIQFKRVLFVHSGWYTCAASNEYGRTERDYLVIVVENSSHVVLSKNSSKDGIHRRSAPAADDFSPSTLNSTYNISSNEEITLNCYTNSSQSRFFQWYKNSEIIESATNATLTVAGSSTGETWGHYCCRIRSSPGSSTSSTLDTRCAVVIVTLESQLDISPPISVSVPTGRSVSLLCSGSTMNRINLPQFTWTKNSAIIPEGLNRLSVQQSRYAITTLLIKDTLVSDSGTYRCNGVNPINNISASTQVIIADVCNGSSNLLAVPEEIGLTRDYVVDINGEICFIIDDTDTVLEYDLKMLNISKTQQIHFSCRMRAESGSSLRPLVTLMITDKRPIDITLPFPSSTAWQWVWHKVQIDATNKLMPQIKVKIATTRSPDSTGPVYFDHLCLTLSDISHRPRALVTPTLVIVPLSTGSNSCTISTVFDFLIVVGASVAVFMILVITCCLWYWRRNMKSSVKVLRKDEEKVSEPNGSAGQKLASSLDKDPAEVSCLNRQLAAMSHEQFLDKSDSSEDKDMSDLNGSVEQQLGNIDSDVRGSESVDGADAEVNKTSGEYDNPWALHKMQTCLNKERSVEASHEEEENMASDLNGSVEAKPIYLELIDGPPATTPRPENLPTGPEPVYIVPQAAAVKRTKKKLKRFTSTIL